MYSKIFVENSCKEYKRFFRQFFWKPSRCFFEKFLRVFILLWFFSGIFYWDCSSSSCKCFLLRIPSGISSDIYSVFLRLLRFLPNFLKIFLVILMKVHFFLLILEFLKNVLLKFLKQFFQDFFIIILGLSRRFYWHFLLISFGNSPWFSLDFF